MTKLSINEMKAIQAENNLHWFDEDAMNFFNTQIETQPNKINIFITSDRMELDMPKKYTLRWFNPETFNVDTLGEFQAYDTLDEAREARKEYTHSYTEYHTVRP
ncbi:hypothetical protein HWC53_gp065 [Bacillus phage vB_BmeM-Goe8]|uniref:Uncharacterized protein n=1 Tax=Bacillus phage vB_BmeM-Goe8 TaxID=2593638 RepID=A0A516KN51_9CAUD|nr:hypothetical protein HWC53_gp013 [Bacillus phage vB_BmeM-Goe8]YP_009850185.1 hypothetical protein HWC53_gp065 [Bacillus phage vB_BmeM-Goe8]QDP42797.1 hypothetical protein Goe8_c00130 [Bacillus phage vB_BmeM-Goe8]QDP43024.1 hypothetical protein Goe8_c02510 [Bacillus phage vB_BmeM-Goe8]